MSTINQKMSGATFSILVGAMLSACGGGGGGDAVSTDRGATAPTAASTLVGSVSPANYAGGSEASAAYTYLNAQRQLCGFGLLQQAALTDTAAQGHSDWMAANGQTSHTQNQASYPTGFTGARPADRLTAAGYAYVTAGEVISRSDGAVAAYGGSHGQAAVMDLFLAPYHGLAMLEGYRDLGFGFSTKAAAMGFPQFNWTTIKFGTTASRPAQLLGSSDVATYPCNGATGVLAKSYADEVPAPIPGRNLETTPIGHPIYVKVRDGQQLTLTSYDLRAAGTNVSLPLILLNKANDPNANITDHSSAILMPNAPLGINSSYVFTASGTNAGQPLAILFSFSTGAN